MERKRERDQSTQKYECQLYNHPGGANIYITSSQSFSYKTVFMASYMVVTKTKKSICWFLINATSILSLHYLLYTTWPKMFCIDSHEVIFLNNTLILTIWTSLHSIITDCCLLICLHLDIISYDGSGWEEFPRPGKSTI